MADVIGAIATVGMAAGAIAELIIVGVLPVGAPTIPYDGSSMIARLSDAIKAFSHEKHIAHAVGTNRSCGRDALTYSSMCQAG